MLFCRLVCKVVKENGDEGAGLNGLKLYPQEGFRAGGKEDFEVPQVAELLVHDKALDANPSSPAQDVSKMGVDEVAQDHHQDQGEYCFKKALGRLQPSLQV